MNYLLGGDVIMADKKNKVVYLEVFRTKRMYKNRKTINNDSGDFMEDYCEPPFLSTEIDEEISCEISEVDDWDPF